MATNTLPTRRAYTLIEVLVMVVIMGIAGAMVIPAMGETGVIRVQAALRAIVSDITFAQSDAVAFQERRAVVFDKDNSSYAVVEVPGNSIDVAGNTMFDPTRIGGKMSMNFPQDERFGDTRITDVDFGASSNAIIFDSLGGPVATASGNTPGPGGTLSLTGSAQGWRVTVEAFTGRVRVSRVPAGG